MSKEVIFTKNAPAAPPYASQGIICNGVIHCSGSLAFEPGTMKVISGGIKAETRQIIKNLEAVLKAGGSSLADVIKVNIFITSMDDFKAMNEAYDEFFAELPQKPVRVLEDQNVLLIANILNSVGLVSEFINWRLVQQSR